MGIVVLTTETTHHAYFVRELARIAPIDWVMLETATQPPPFETAHPYEAQRNLHECGAWFDGKSPAVGEFAEAWRAESVNDSRVSRRLRERRPDVVIVFGTGRLYVETIAACGANAVNLHGGAPPAYRGLDSHLWSIYHRDFESLVTTLHRVSSELDRGDIIEQARLPLQRGMQLHEVRQINTEMCVRLMENTLRVIGRGGFLSGVPQTEKGRYYSHMPSVLKSLCVARFAAHTRSLE